ncbi:MAG: DNA translocase FtsK [Erysipelotrichaceae bacterium]
MAKSKQKKNSKNDQSIDAEILIYVYAIVIISLSIIGILQVGFVGSFLSNIIKFIFGEVYGVIYALAIGFGILLFTKKSLRDIPYKYILGCSVLLFAWILASSLPKDHTISGFRVLNEFTKNATSIFNGTLSAHGGIVGALLYSVSSFLFAYNGTLVIIVGLVVFGVIVLVNKSIVEWIKTKGNRMHEAIQERNTLNKEKRAAKKLAKEEGLKEVETYEEEYDQPRDIDYDELGVIIEDETNNDRKLEVPFSNDVVKEVITMPKKKGSINFIEADGELVNTKEIDDSKPINGEQTTIDDFTSEYEEDYSNYKLPSINLLKTSDRKSNKSNVNNAAAADAGKKLIAILDEFGVKATLVDTHVGSSVTKFEIKPDLGVRVNKISNLQYDIKMALAAKDIRIEAPIPGKSAVGIEIPNVEKTMVHMKELMKNVPEVDNKKKLLFALGRDLMGNCVYGELNKMPHLLVAGATGSGKSVCINSILTSILMRSKPDEVKLLLIDPKKVEFTPYHNIPHLIGPVISDATEAARALKVVVEMMDNRYELFSQAQVRNIAGYNTYLEKHRELGMKKLPWIVIVVDELADLMLVAAKEVEGNIQRITQLARAAGIHLIVATQRPSVDVITGVIKANIPSRIAFAVSSAIDSRTILDQGGAEKLLGFGDMLYIPVGEQTAIRAQGAFVSDEEVNDICACARKQGKPKYDDAFIRLELLDGGPKSTETFADPLYDEVKEFIIATNKASTSYIQRKFSIGYARAARIIDVMEERGIVGPARGSKPRAILIKKDDES